MRATETVHKFSLWHVFRGWAGMASSLSLGRAAPEAEGARQRCGAAGCRRARAVVHLGPARYFAAAVEHGSMTRASRGLMVSQSAVSAAIAQLEKELGVQLLLRQHAKGLVPTAAGRDFYQEVRRFLTHAAELEETARSAGAAPAGELTVAASRCSRRSTCPRCSPSSSTATPRSGLASTRPNSTA